MAPIIGLVDKHGSTSLPTYCAKHVLAGHVCLLARYHVCLLHCDIMTFPAQHSHKVYSMHSRVFTRAQHAKLSQGCKSSGRECVTVLLAMSYCHNYRLHIH